MNIIAAITISSATCNLTNQTPTFPFLPHSKQSHLSSFISLHKLSPPSTNSIPTSRTSITVSNSRESQPHNHKLTILVSEKLGEAGLSLLRAFGHVECSYNLSPEDLCARIGDFDALIVRSGTKVTRRLFEAANGRLKVVGRAGVGIDNVDRKAATEFGCLVVNAPTANTIAAAEHGIALLTAMARNVAQADASMKAGKWERDKYFGVSVVEKTLAVMGFGRVGCEVARRAKGLGMHVIAHDPYAPVERARAIGVDLVSFDEALSIADFLSLHVPLTSSTERMFNDEAFAKMKKGVRIINVARGGVVDEDALLRALDTGIVAQAALDVFMEEPPSKDGKLARHENVIATPHLGASTKEAQEQVAIEIAEAVVGALRGELSATAVNAPIISPQVMAELGPYVTLAEKLGRIAVQFVRGGSGIRSVKVIYGSSWDPDNLDTRILRAMIIKGIIEPISDAHVNLVNADFIAKQKRLQISEKKLLVTSSSSEEQPVEWIQVEISDIESRFEGALLDNRKISIEGKVKLGGAQLTRVGAFSVAVSLEGNVILCRQVDRPGTIGQVGNILGEDNVNVSYMSVVRNVKRGKAIMAIGVDEEPDKSTLKKIGEVPAIDEFVFLHL